MSIMESAILYVDDERANRVVFEQSFGKKYLIKSVESAEAALEVLEHERIAMVVTDQRMPGMGGNQLLERCKALYPEVVRVVITAHSDIEPIMRAVNDGLVARYIVKPWDRAELEEILRWGLEAFRLGQESSALQRRLLQTERLVTLGSIGAAVIHDINQPVSYLFTNSERLKYLSQGVAALHRALDAVAEQGLLSAKDKADVEALAEELPEIARDMTEGCNVIFGLTNGIRKMLRPCDDEPRDCDPVPAVRYAISVCRSIAVHARGTLINDAPTSLPRLRIHATGLTRVLINVVSNAAHALAERKQPGGRVVVHAVEEGDVVRFTITDDGPGMSPETIDKVGTPFFSTRSDGTGLGVMQCKRLLEEAGGQLHIDTVQGRGTTVTFTVPKL